MKLLKKKPVISKVVSNQKEKEKKAKTLPPDTYKDEIEAIEVVIDDSRKFIFSVKRGGEYGLPCVDFRQYSTTEAYTGFTKKGVNFPLEYLCDIIDALQSVQELCEEKGIKD